MESLIVGYISEEVVEDGQRETRSRVGVRV